MLQPEKFFLIDRPISDELVALTFGFSLFQFPKISNNAITNQPISDELGASPKWFAFQFPKISCNAFTAFEVKRRPPILSLKIHLPPLVVHNLD